MSDYTPTTEEVLDAYVAILMVAARGEGVLPKKDAYRQAVNRWLAEHDREQRAIGWGEACDHLAIECEHNPYREVSK